MVDRAAGGDQVLYLYGVIPRGQSLPDEPGVEIRAVVHAELAALVEAVSAEELSLDRGEQLAALDRVARIAQKHEAVLESAMRHGPVVPSRLGNLFSSEEAVRRSLAANEDGFLAALERIRGREEWGLKLFCDEARLRAVLGPDDPHVRGFEAAMASASPGHAFVLGKKREARLAEIATGRIDGLIEETIDALEPETVDMRLLRSLLADVAGEPRTQMALNLAVLVDVAVREVFHEAVATLAERFREEGFTFEVSGPWPAYNFCAGEEGDPLADSAEDTAAVCTG